MQTCHRMSNKQRVQSLRRHIVDLLTDSSKLLLRVGRLHHITQKAKKLTPVFRSRSVYKW